ncbi:MAG: metalloregulator ArsR/SmtB family transcription factor [Bacillota bacterium]|nr:metalloregulator ArsR/SmtB family transcription factor [Bacillota bacterium]
MVEMLKALADGNRLRIVNILFNGELCVCEIEYLLGMTQTNVSRHLNKLRIAGIVERKKQAQYIHYRLDEAFIGENAGLMNYIKNKAALLPCPKKDMENYKKYRESGSGCEQIRKMVRGNK